MSCTNRYGSRISLCHGALFAINNYVGTTSTRPRRKSSRVGSTTEVEELVRVLLRKASDEKSPLVTSLNKYVRIVRTEHCFHLFEELGRQDRWLQCLEVSFASACNGFTFLKIYEKKSSLSTNPCCVALVCIL